VVRKRVTLSLAVIAGFLLLALLDSAIEGGPIFHIFVGVTMVAALLEVYGLAERHGDEPMKGLPVALVVVLVVWDYALRLGQPSEEGWAALRSFYASTGMAVAMSLWVLAVAQLLVRDPYRWFKGAPATLFGFLYVWFLGAHFFPLRGMGMGYVLALVATTKLGDSGAYFVGTRWGRHRLAPRTSPNKTIEGAIGGLASSILCAVLADLVLGLDGGVGFWVAFGLVVGVAAQLGDLVESAIKRAAGAKDSGQLLPALGGVLDLVDSPLMGAPVALWLLAA